jgi:hypothetical protein
VNDGCGGGLIRRTNDDMSTTTVTSPESVPPDNLEWAVAGMFLDARTRRDFTALRACLDSEVRLQALAPRGPFELCGADETVGHFAHWSGECDVLEVLDAAIGQVGTRMYLRWRVQQRTPGSCAAELIEQHAFVTADDRIRSLDLLCSRIQT